jgi:hypothetical protein
MMAKITFADILEVADQLPIEDQEQLISILQNRVRDHKRSVLVRDVSEAQREFAQGKCQPMTVEQLMGEILE